MWAHVQGQVIMGHDSDKVGTMFLHYTCVWWALTNVLMGSTYKICSIIMTAILLVAFVYDVRE